MVSEWCPPCCPRWMDSSCCKRWVVRALSLARCCISDVHKTACFTVNELHWPPSTPYPLYVTGTVSCLLGYPVRVSQVTFLWLYFLFVLGVCSSVSRLVRVITWEDTSPYRSASLAKEGRCGESFRVPLPQPKVNSVNSHYPAEFFFPVAFPIVNWVVKVRFLKC